MKNLILVIIVTFSSLYSYSVFSKDVNRNQLKQIFNILESKKMLNKDDISKGREQLNEMSDEELARLNEFTEQIINDNPNLKSLKDGKKLDEAVKTLDIDSFKKKTKQIKSIIELDQ